MTDQQQGIGSGGVVLGFVIGAVVGAAAALLLAPASGRETRDVMNRRAREARDRAVEAARQGREELNRQRQNITTAFDRARQQAQGTTPEPEREG
jgi:gas vesicle protein